jgi:chromosome segregation ATPase
VTRRKQSLPALRRSTAAAQTRFERRVDKALKDLAAGLAASQARISRLELANRRQSAQRSRLRQEVRGLHSRQGKLRKRLARVKPDASKNRRRVTRIKPAMTAHLLRDWKKFHLDPEVLALQGQWLAVHYGLDYKRQVKRAFGRFKTASLAKIKPKK